MRRDSGSWRPRRTVATNTSTGARPSKTCWGVRSSRTAPTIPPARDGSPKSTMSDRSGRWRRKPKTPPRFPAQRPTVSVALAATGATPTQTRVGNVSRLPPPAMALTKPAAMATAKTTPCFQGATAATTEGTIPGRYRGPASLPNLCLDSLDAWGGFPDTEGARPGDPTPARQEDTAVAETPSTLWPAEHPSAGENGPDFTWGP